MGHSWLDFRNGKDGYRHIINGTGHENMIEEFRHKCTRRREHHRTGWPISMSQTAKQAQTKPPIPERAL